MILGKRGIQAALEKGLAIEGLDPKNIRPASIDLKLHTDLLCYVDDGNMTVDIRNPERRPKPVAITMETGYRLDPGEWLLGATAEIVIIPPHLVGIVCGKSSWARDGLSIEDAGYIDPGWTGRISLEIKNNGPLTIILYPGMLICQIRFMPVLGQGEEDYLQIEGSHYWGSQGPVANMMGSNRKILDSDVDEYGRVAP
jgi:dCTP deaminase